MEITSDLWPCLGEPGLRVFATTADQRYQIGEDVFLATHFPVALRRFPPGHPAETIEEAMLLDQILTTSGLQPGNRVFVLYGAAGSGKSEFMKWLQVMITRRDPARAEFTVRIPRTELDVMHIAERFHHLLSDAYFTDATRRRWENARQKPRTLSKLLLLTALERCLDADEQINALYYRLLDWIHPHIARSLATLEKSDPNTGKPITLLTREDLDELKSETALPVPLDYEQFRHHLLTAFREHLMEGQYLPDTLSRIADDLERRGIRPILLVDDLVQSLNLFATDLLDYFITLDSGNWDVVLGLTPAALSAGERGGELLERITHLDTVDDRVEKLWLSDVQGNASYFLTEETCATFAGRYLAAYREHNGWACAACPEQGRCAGLGSNGKGALLAPFNRALLQRLFRGLPEGKGKVRYFLRHLREVLAVVGNGGDLLATLRRYAEPDTAVEADDEILAQVAEFYGPSTSDHRVTLPADLVAAFGGPSRPITLLAEPLRRSRTSLESFSSPEPLNDPGRAAIKSWLDGETVNRQSLLQLRKGISRWLRTAQPVRPLHAPDIARPHRVLRWHKVYLSVRPPIILEDVDEGDGIRVTRDIGLTAFRLYDFAEATGDDRKALIAVLASEERLLPLIQAAADYHQMVRQRLEKQLGMPIAELALALYTWLAIAQGPPQERPPGFGECFWDRIEVVRTRLPVWQGEPDEALCQSISYLFDDFFRLRKHVYDGREIARVIGGQTPEALLDALTAIAPECVDKDYRLKKRVLRDVLATVQEKIKRWRQPSDEGLSAAAQAVVKTLGSDGNRGIPLREVPSEVFSELREERPDLYAALRVVVARPPGVEGHAD
jgi:hypothetical protein